VSVAAGGTPPATAPRRRRPRVDFAAFQELTALAAYFIPFTIRTVCEMGIGDLLADGPLGIQEIARRTDTHAPSMYRALRALASRGVLEEREDRTFALTAMGDLLRSDHPLSLRDTYCQMPEDVAAWQHLGHSLRTGEPAFDHVHGAHLWDYLAEHPEVSERFDRGMQAMTRPELLAVSSSFAWEGLSTVVDVGGGNGAFLAGLLRRHRQLQGTLFDLPHVVDRADEVLLAAGVADRCEVVAGSFFGEVPAGADAYLLKRIVYGWDDDGALALLRQVRAAMSRDSRILVIEPIDRPGNEDQMARILDLLMLVVDGGRARSPHDLAELFTVAGLELTEVLDTMAFPIVVGRRAP
jgi:hypothetical protein